MDKTTNFKRKGFFVIKIILLFLVVLMLFWHLKKAKFSFDNFELVHPLGLIVVLLLMPLNWFLEFLKWRITVNSLRLAIAKTDLKSSFYAGIVTGMLTPNMLGNFVGRIFYFERRDRIQLVLWTLISNFAQFLITVFYGVLAFLLYREGSFKISDKEILFLPFLAIALLLLYYQYDKVLRLFSFVNNKVLKRLIYQKKDLGLLTQLMVQSFFRYAVFITQFSLVLWAFGADISLNAVFQVMQYYFILTFFPSLFLGKFLIRDSVALMVLGGVVASNEVVLLSSLSIWIINLLLPTLFALFVINLRKT